MRHLRWILVSLLLLAGSSAWGHDAKLQAELLDEVLRLTHAEVPDAIILEQIEAWGFAFELTADDIVELRTLGVSDAVIRALVQTALWEDEVVVTRPRVYLSAGFYSPWYCFPYAWAGYWDPFPRLYAHFYYPFYYSVGFGYYGWCRSTYYAYYYPRAWRRGHGGRHPSPYTVAGQRPARRAQTIVVPGSKRAGGGTAVSPRVIRGSRSGTPTLRRAEQLRTPQASRPLRGVPSRNAPSRSLQRSRGSDGSPVVQPRPSRRAQTPTWQRGSRRSSTVHRALPRQRSWSTPRGAPSQRSLSPMRSGWRASSGLQSAPRMRSVSPMRSMPRATVPRSMTSHFRAARSR